MQVSTLTRTRPSTSWCLCSLFRKIIGLLPDSRLSGLSQESNRITNADVL